ncbi:hypothetical protein [Streptomyces albidoflavus]|uniref:hypothetical protein n=1 Tax=Streptomyces TaxID=1883 RepID=UPI001020FFB6|nr:hypothetical protein [Streptomyces albidoflavus]
MENEQLPVPASPVSKAEARRQTGLSRDVIDAAIKKGELSVVDRKGLRGAERVDLEQVLRLAARRGITVPCERPGCAEREREHAARAVKLNEALAHNREMEALLQSFAQPLLDFSSYSVRRSVSTPRSPTE